jgi:hypothetical protein
LTTGIRIDYCRNVELDNVRVVGFDTGISFHGSEDVVIKDTRVKDTRVVDSGNCHLMVARSFFKSSLSTSRSIRPI